MGDLRTLREEVAAAVERQARDRAFCVVAASLARSKKALRSVLALLEKVHQERIERSMRGVGWGGFTLVPTRARLTQRRAWKFARTIGLRRFATTVGGFDWIAVEDQLFFLRILHQLRAETIRKSFYPKRLRREMVLDYCRRRLYWRGKCYRFPRRRPSEARMLWNADQGVLPDQWHHDVTWPALVCSVERKGIPVEWREIRGAIRGWRGNKELDRLSIPELRQIYSDLRDRLGFVGRERTRYIVTTRESVTVHDDTTLPTQRRPLTPTS